MFRDLPSSQFAPSRIRILLFVAIACTTLSFAPTHSVPARQGPALSLRIFEAFAWGGEHWHVSRIFPSCYLIIMFSVAHQTLPD